MIEWLWNLVVALFRRSEGEAAEALSKANAGIDRLNVRLESQLVRAETQLESARRELEDCLSQRRTDAQRLMEIEAKIKRLEPPHGPQI